MRKQAVTVQIPEGLDDRDVALILRDALADFIRARSYASVGGVYGYVERRYPEMSREWRAEKVVEVTQRIDAANAMRDAPMQTIEVSDDGQ